MVAISGSARPARRRVSSGSGASAVHCRVRVSRGTVLASLVVALFALMAQPQRLVFADGPSPTPTPRPVSPLNVGHVHLFPVHAAGGQLAPLAQAQAPIGGPLLYHRGPVMPSNVSYAIFWLPAGQH